ncbi:MAG: UDP-glucose 4-epimerase GalE [Parachlamydiaceae bacterium]|nr:UDP-glucose 4-epimerase GalE [Parachlamydiaceae bacterium]
MNRRPVKNKTILIVGGAGYIGSHVNKLLYLHGYDTVVFDNLSHGDSRNVLYGSFFEGDLENASDLKNLFKAHSFDGVMHFAALTDVGESIRNPAVYYRNNVSNTLNLLDIAVENGVKFFVFSSSAAIFGMPIKDLIDEQHSRSPINPYGHSKLIVEAMLQDYDQAYGLKSCSLRYFNAAGADPECEIVWYDRKENNLIPLLLKSLKDPSKKVTLFGTDYPTVDGTCIRDYIHVYDLAEAHIRGLEKLMTTQTSSSYNLGNGRGFSVYEVVRAVEKVTGKSLQIIEGPRRPGDPAILVADSKKASLELGWKPQYSEIETMIEHAYKAMFSLAEE